MSEQALIQFRVDKDLKRDVAAICDQLGMDMPTVFRMCMKQMCIVRGLPFPVTLPAAPASGMAALDAFREIRRLTADTPEMDLDEIKEEIRAARAERKAAQGNT